MKIVGLGGMGCFVVRRLAKQVDEGLDLLAIDSDKRNLAPHPALKSLHIGSSKKGMNGNPLKGREAAELAKDAFFDNLAGTKKLLLVAGMGGGTGTGAAHVLAYVAKELRIDCQAYVSMPFALEGDKVGQIARLGLEALGRFVENIVIAQGQVPQNTALPPTLASMREFLAYELYFHLLTALPEA